jgi:hypothetical protein
MITKDEFVTNLKTQLDELSKGIEKVEHLAKTVQESAKIKLTARVKYFQHKHALALTKLQEIKNSGEEAWDELKQVSEDVVSNLKEGLSKTLSHFKKRDPNLAAGKAAE